MVYSIVITLMGIFFICMSLRFVFKQIQGYRSYNKSFQGAPDRRSMYVSLAILDGVPAVAWIILLVMHWT